MTHYGSILFSRYVPMQNSAAEQERQPLVERSALSFLTFLGWTSVYNIPREKSYVMIVAKHTSLWDYPLTLLCALASGEKYHWLAHPALFYGPLKYITKRFGGIPLYTKYRSGTVARLSKQMRNHEKMKIFLTPEGTTAYMPRWRTGFYYIAKTAKVPIALGYIDYHSKTLGINVTIYPSNDIKKDLHFIANYYKPVKPKNPDRAGPIVF